MFTLLDVEGGFGWRPEVGAGMGGEVDLVGGQRSVKVGMGGGAKINLMSMHFGSQARRLYFFLPSFDPPCRSHRANVLSC